MTRGIDHIVHVVRDLDAARAMYERLGFQAGAENVHPWGTRNRLVQFPGSYIELLSIPEPSKLPQVPPGTYSFGSFNHEFLESCGEGLSFLVLQSRDPAAGGRARGVADVAVSLARELGLGTPAVDAVRLDALARAVLPGSEAEATSATRDSLGLERDILAVSEAYFAFLDGAGPGRPAPDDVIDQQSVEGIGLHIF